MDMIYTDQYVDVVTYDTIYGERIEIHTHDGGYTVGGWPDRKTAAISLLGIVRLLRQH